MIYGADIGHLEEFWPLAVSRLLPVLYLEVPVIGVSSTSDFIFVVERLFDKINFIDKLHIVAHAYVLDTLGVSLR